MGFGAGIYVGTKYDCNPVTFITNCIKNNIPKMLYRKKRRR